MENGQEVTTPQEPVVQEAPKTHTSNEPKRKPVNPVYHKTKSGIVYYTIGQINIPKVKINYPIISETNNTLMKIGITKYWGCNPNEVGNMCLVGHNYRNDLFFSKIPNSVNIGDSIFIELPNKEIMLIDAGESYYSKRVIDYIDNLGYKKIDYVVGTHPHTDHIGGLESIIKKYDIGSVYMPKKQSNSRTFLNLLKAIKEKSLKINTAKSGISIIDSDNLKVKIISPTKEYNDSNNSSAVIKINYINRCFLFMGDAEVDAEKSITDDLECDVVKIGHHGSDTSSSESFVKKTKAKYAIVSVGANNKYKHPYDFVLKRWENIGSKVLRTDQLGDIVISTDGNNLIVNNEMINDNTNIEKKSYNTNHNSEIEIINISTVAGETGEIKIKGEANKEYDIKLYYSSGVSKAKGLEKKMSDNEGYVTWNFNIPKNTKRGNYKFMINDCEFEYELK